MYIFLIQYLRNPDSVSLLLVYLECNAPTTYSIQGCILMSLTVWFDWISRQSRFIFRMSSMLETILCTTMLETHINRQVFLWTTSILLEGALLLIGRELKLYYESLLRHIKESPQLILRVLGASAPVLLTPEVCDICVFDPIYLIFNSDSCNTRGLLLNSDRCSLVSWRLIGGGLAGAVDNQ